MTAKHKTILLSMNFLVICLTLVHYTQQELIILYMYQYDLISLMNLLNH